MITGEPISPVGVNFGKTRTGTVFLEMDANGKIDLSPVGVNFGKTRAGIVFLEILLSPVGVNFEKPRHASVDFKD